MDPFFSSSLVFITLFLGVQAYAQINQEFKEILGEGMKIWASLLPTMALFVLAIMVSFGMLGIWPKSLNLFKLVGHLDSVELILLMSALPLLCFHFGYLISLALSVYLSIAYASAGAMSWGIMALVICLNILTILHTELPWLEKNKTTRIHVHFREIINSLVAVMMLGLSFLTILQSLVFKDWIQLKFALQMPKEVLILFLVSAMLLWVSIAIGLSRTILYPLVLLPSIFVAFFVFTNPLAVLAIISIVGSLSFVFAANRSQSYY